MWSTDAVSCGFWTRRNSTEWLIHTQSEGSHKRMHLGGKYVVVFWGGCLVAACQPWIHCASKQ